MLDRSRLSKSILIYQSSWISDISAKMNSKQRIAVVVGLLIVTALLVYPPWRIEQKNPPVFAHGHIAVWRVGYDLDIVPLIVECVIVAILTLVAVMLLRGKNSS
jgi:hypothetical protein